MILYYFKSTLLPLYVVPSKGVASFPLLGQEIGGMSYKFAD